MRKGIALFLLIIVAVGSAVLVTVGQEGESRVEAWVGRELKQIVNAGDQFVLDFDAIDYQAPDRVVMTKMTLSLADSEGKVGPLVEIGEGTVELAKLPRPGEPIEIKVVELTDPTIRIESFLAASKHGMKKRGSGEKRLLSSILTLRRVEIENGSICYDDGKGSPLSWTQLNARLNLESRDSRWHAVRVTIDQSPLMKADIATELNIDSMIARGIDVKATLDLNSPDALRFFTPPLQRLLTKWEVRGHAEVSASGIVNAKQREQTALDAAFRMDGAHVSTDKYKLPIEQINAAAQVRGNLLRVDPLNVQTLQGQVAGSATLQMDGAREVVAQTILSKINVQELLKTQSSASGESELSGLLDADVRINSSLADLKAVAGNLSDGVRWGSGYVNLTQGRLVRLPVIEQIMYATRQVTGIFTGKGQNRETFEAQFLLIDQVVDVGGMLYRGDGVGMRGKGRIGMNGELDLTVNAGPLERLQGTLGSIGEAWGRLTDRFMGYSVQGTFKEPIVRPMLGSR